HVNHSRCSRGAAHTLADAPHPALFGGVIDSGQPSLAPFHTSAHIEPEGPLRIPAEAVTIGRHTLQSGYLERLERAGLGIHSPQADVVIGHVIRKPDIAVQIGLRVVYAVGAAQT